MRKRKTRILFIIGCFFLLLQLISYFGNSLDKDPPKVSGAEAAGYYTGLHLFLLLSVICFIWAFRNSKQLKRAQQQELIDSIGKPE